MVASFPEKVGTISPRAKMAFLRHIISANNGTSIATPLLTLASLVDTIFDRDVQIVASRRHTRLLAVTWHTSMPSVEMATGGTIFSNA